MLGSFDYPFTILDSLSARVYEDKNLLMLTQVTQYNVIALLVVNVTNVALARDVIICIFGIFDSHEMDQKRDWTICSVKVKESGIPWDSKKISDIQVVW